MRQIWGRAVKRGTTHVENWLSRHLHHKTTEPWYKKPFMMQSLAGFGPHFHPWRCLVPVHSSLSSGQTVLQLFALKAVCPLPPCLQDECRKGLVIPGSSLPAAMPSISIICGKVGRMVEIYLTRQFGSLWKCHPVQLILHIYEQVFEEEGKLPCNVAQ